MLSGSNYSAVDLDDCRDATTGTFAPWAIDQIKRSGSYAEVTPSNEGARIIGLSTGEPLHRKFTVPDANGISCELYRKADRFITITGEQIGTATALANIDVQIDALLAELDDAKQTKSKARSGSGEATHKRDLDSLIRDGCSDDFGGDRSRAVWYVVNQLLKQGRSGDDIVALLLDQANGISAHIYDQREPEEYARKQVDKAQKGQAADPDAEIARLARLSAVSMSRSAKPRPGN